MIWVVDKKTVPYLLQHAGVLAEVPVRVSFEYAIDAGRIVGGSLSTKTLYNKGSVCRTFPDLDGVELESAVQLTVIQAIDEHLALCGYGGIDRARVVEQTAAVPV